MPKVSVVMSVYNGERYIGEAIESVLNQTFADFEFIIVNDGSNDNTAQIVESFGDPRIVVISQENMGIPKSRNKGVRISTGEYIAVHDADDVSLPHRLERGVKFLDENQDYVIVGSSYYQIDEKGKRGELVRVLTENADLKVCLMKRNCFGHGSIMMRRRAFLEAGGYDENFRYSLDYDLFLRLAEKGKVANMKEPLYYYRLVRTGVSVQKIEEQRRYAELAILAAERRGALPRYARTMNQKGLFRNLWAFLEAEGLTEVRRIAEIYGQTKFKAYPHFFFKLAEARAGLFLRRHGLKSVVRLYRKLFYPHMSDSV